MGWLYFHSLGEDVMESCDFQALAPAARNAKNMVLKWALR
jgi:hypothetical protein